MFVNIFVLLCKQNGKTGYILIVLPLFCCVLFCLWGVNDIMTINQLQNSGQLVIHMALQDS